MMIISTEKYADAIEKSLRKMQGLLLLYVIPPDSLGF